MKFLEKVARRVLNRPAREETEHGEYMRLALELEEAGLLHGVSYNEVKNMKGSEIQSIFGAEEYGEVVRKLARMTELWGFLTPEQQAYHRVEDKELADFEAQRRRY